MWILFFILSFANADELLDVESDVFKAEDIAMPKVQTPDWAREIVTEGKSTISYVGYSSGKPSESLAIDSAEKQAIEEMVKDSFGIEVQYASISEESLQRVKLRVRKSAISGLIKMPSIRKVKFQSARDPDGYLAWVQIRVSRKDISEEKSRLKKLAANSSLAEIESERDIKMHNSIGPKISIGQTKAQVLRAFGAPDRYAFNSDWNKEYWHYSNQRLCTGPDNHCTVEFRYSRVTEFSGISSKYVNFSGK